MFYFIAAQMCNLKHWFYELNFLKDENSLKNFFNILLPKASKFSASKLRLISKV